LLVDDRGNLTEGSGYNVFAVRDGRIVTPDARTVLGGVSRRFAIDLAGELGIEVAETDLQAFHLLTADEAFFTGTSPCVLPVTRADREPIGDGSPGPVTRRLLDAWSARVGLDIADQMLKYA
jgi:branched-chain amino acid aminotransferase